MSDEHVEPAVSSPKEAPKKNGSSVADYGLASDQNQRFRRRMEDAHFLADGFNNDPQAGFFAVYDGHGGKEAALFCSQNLHHVLAEELNAAGGKEFYTNADQSEAVLEILKKTYINTDRKMVDNVPQHHGCTSVTVLVAGSLAENNRHLFSANAGDGRAVLCRDGQAVRLTVDHKASEEAEVARITEAGGFIIGGRVNGQIMITRSLGDHLMKEYIIGEPYVQHETLTEKDTWLIVACDGLWDVVSDQAAVDFVLENAEHSASDISRRLLVKALQDGSTDNLSVSVIKLL